MFEGAIPFNRNIGKWEVHNVNNMSSMFEGASSFNCNGKPHAWERWDVCNVTSMRKMFKDAVKFNTDIRHWKVEKLEDVESMFEGASSFQTSVGGCFVWFLASTDNNLRHYDDDECWRRKGARSLGEHWATNEVVVRQLRESSPNVAIGHKDSWFER